MIETPRPFDSAQGRLEAKRGIVTPAEAGVQILDSRFHGNDVQMKVLCIRILEPTPRIPHWFFSYSLAVLVIR